MGYSRQIRRNSKINRVNHAESVQMNTRTKEILLSTLLNITFFCILWLVSDLDLLSAILLVGYELVLGIMVWRSLKNANNKYRGYLGIWNLLVIVASGVLFRLKYEFFEVPQGLFSWSLDEKKVLVISGLIAIWMVVIINKIAHIKPETWMNLIIVCALVFSLTGQILLLNDTLLSKEYEKIEYSVNEKIINDRIFKSYLVDLKYDDMHGFVISVGKEAYDKINIDDKHLVTVYKGGLGFKYVKTNKKYLKW